MAFNPFNWFRKHQKVLFAGLIIVTMFIFIGSFGMGDPFQALTSWIGGRRHGGSLLATLNGKKIYESDTQHLAARRKLASDFLFQAAWDGHSRARKDLLDNLKTSGLDGESRSQVEKILLGSQRRPEMILEFARQNFPPFFVLQQLQNDFNELEVIAARDKVRNDPEKLEVLQKATAILGFQVWMASHPRSLVPLFMGRGPEVYYFGTLYPAAPPYARRIEENLDFMLWQQQADRLGIKLSDADVCREVVAEAAGWSKVFESDKPTFVRDRRVLDFMKTHAAGGEARSLMPRDLLDALREEFRVVLAQGLLMGQEPGVRLYRTALSASASPVVASPDEFYRFVVDQRTDLTVKFYPISTLNYLDKVKVDLAPEKLEAELRTRYNRYKDVEPSATSRDPGFKEPRRVAVEYVSGSPEDKHYREQAEAQVTAMRLGPVFGWVGGSALNRAVAIAFDPVSAEYSASVERSLRLLDPEWKPAADWKGRPEPDYIRDEQHSWFYKSMDSETS